MATDYTIPKEEYRALVAENARLRDLMYSRAHDHAIQHMSEDELRITAANALDENAKLRELLAIASDMARDYDGDRRLLRELVRDMWHLMDGSGVTTGAWGRCVQILDRMRELGVEP